MTDFYEDDGLDLLDELNSLYEEELAQELSALSSHRQELSSLLAARLLGQEE